VAGAMSYLNKLPRPAGDDILGRIQTRTDQLGSDLDARYEAAREAMTQLGLVLVSDYGKLSGIGGSILHHIGGKVHTDSWLLPADPDGLKAPVVKAAKQVFFSALMRTAWDTWDVRSVGNARDWYCLHRVPIVRPPKIVRHHIWRDEPDGGQFPVTNGFAAGGAPQNAQRSLGIPKAQLDLANPPPDSLVRPLFNPIDRDANSNNLGLYKPWFYRDFARHAVTIEFKANC
jgi:hypothetical protein